MNGGRVRSRDAEQPRRLTNPTETPEIKDEQRIISDEGRSRSKNEDCTDKKPKR